MYKRQFLRKIDADNLQIVWEPRGKSWLDNQRLIMELCKEFKLTHCVDPFRAEPVYVHKTLYFRLHGLGRPTVYNYKFTDSELAELKDKVRATCDRCYVLFNNVYMYEDALNFGKIVCKSQHKKGALDILAYDI